MYMNGVEHLSESQQLKILSLNQRFVRLFSVTV